MEKDSRIFIAGRETLIGAAIALALERKGYSPVIDFSPDLGDASEAQAFFAKTQPEYVLMAAGRSGGIRANQKYPADLMLDNLLVNSHVLHEAFRSGVRKLLYLASSCCYPKDAPQPMRVESLMTGPLEPTNEAYATAKIAGIKLCEAYNQQHGVKFITAIPANAFGPGDDFNADDSHVIAALIRRMHEAKLKRATRVEIWGTGRPEREFIFADDLGDACVFLMEAYDGPATINIGAESQRFSIAGLAEAIKETVGYEGNVGFDSTKPDGMPRKILDATPLKSLGWKPATDFRLALSRTYDYFLQLEKETTHV